MKSKKFVICGDNHGDMADEKSVSALVAFIADFKPEIRVHLGDNWDFRNLRKGASDDEKAASLADDWETGSDFMRAFFDGGKENAYLRGNHSFSDQTELLTKRGFVRVSDVTENDEVAEFDPSSRAIFYSKPLGVVSHHEDYIYRIEGRYSRQDVSSGHDVILWGNKFKAAQLIGQTINESAVSTSGYAVATIGTIDDDWLRLLTWVIMDGCIVNLKKYDPNTTKARVQFHLSLDKKITRLRALLDRLGMKYTFAKSKKTGINKMQPYFIRIYGDAAREIVSRLSGVKKIPSSWASLPHDSLSIFLEELIETDGGKRYKHIAWTSIERDNVNVVQEWCARNGVDCAWTLAERTSGFANGKPLYRIKICYGSTMHWDSKLSITREAYGRNVYCVTMPLGTVVSRCNGKIAFTGNCERMWHFAHSATGVLRDFANDGIKRIEGVVRASRAKMLPYDSALGIYTLGKLSVIHGYHHGVGACRQHAAIYRNAVFGHVHTIESSPVASLEPAEARSIGCLCKRDMDYINAKTGKLRWGQGWAYGLLFEDGTYHLNQARKVHGVFHAASSFNTY